ncbi:hypothetical protein N7509_003403 [Penicillium cosmopolitanum]|uniref:Uncharacterized protein n=1 Tax=Penicillium cosmopolitanum TaxID=1131564 RepID=A0A9W9W522_9EURO|nr:uncharacterized protein N7509_003403 [Penicillium cosmopolitanum]KAJ5403532.1 hypothetical protein N7509_003403 [Penicillium cosmopolitanum]
MSCSRSNVAKATETLVRRPRTPTLEITKDRPSRPPSTELYLPRFDDNPSVRTQFVASFISHFAPSCPVLDGKTGKAVRLQDTFPAFVGSSPILDKAVTAMSCALLAKRRKDFQLLSYSTRLYGEALKTVHSRIANASRCGLDELFATVIFQLYEVWSALPAMSIPISS